MSQTSLPLPLGAADQVQLLLVSIDLLHSTCRRNLATAFRTHIINSPKETEHVSTSSPVRVLGSCSFMYMRHNDVYILAVTKSNANVMLSFQFMTQVSLLMWQHLQQHQSQGAGVVPCSTSASEQLPSAKYVLCCADSCIVQELFWRGIQ